MLILSNSDIEQVLTLKDCLQALEVAYKEYALGKAANRRATTLCFRWRTSAIRAFTSGSSPRRAEPYPPGFGPCA